MDVRIKQRWLVGRFLLAISLGLSAGGALASDSAHASSVGNGIARVLVRVENPGRPRSLLRTRPTQGDRVWIARAQSHLAADLATRRVARARIRRAYRTIPYLALEVDAAELEKLRRSPYVSEILEDRPHLPTLAESAPAIGAPAVWQDGLDGYGQAIAILDTGVDATHPMLAGHVIAEACFSSSADCPNGERFEVGPGAARPCSFSDRRCQHGTHVAGIAAGRDARYSGVAPAANVVAIQVFSRHDQCAAGESVPCPRTFTSDFLAALQWVFENGHDLGIAAVNLSFARSAYSSQTKCKSDDRPVQAIVEQLRAAGIATVAASGNEGEQGALSSPACLPSVISVGAVDDAGEMASFSNRASFLSLLAPGVRITSAGPGATYRSLSGTSMAAPHVAGAFALLRQHDASASVDAMLEALAQTGAAVMPPEGGLTFPLIDVKAAIDLRSGKCPCLRNTNNFCLYASGMCAMTAPGGYCDPNADGDLLDGDWQRGFAEYHDTCVRPPRRSPWFSGQRSQSLRREPLTPVQRAQAHR